MTSGEWLTQATIELQKADIETARLDALVILEDITGINRASLLAHPERVLSKGQAAKLNTFITQRKAHIPLAYIRGEAPFYGRNFYVSPDVLVPRPETEEIVTQLLTARPNLPQNPRIIDVGTGSGCIGITAKLELPEAQVTLLDIDSGALEVARKNTAKHGVEVSLRQADLLAGTETGADVVLANLPYVPTDYPINRAASHEPPIALFSGTDGLDDYRTFWRQIGQLKHWPSHVIIEALPQQGKALRAMAAAQMYKIANAGDFVQHFVRSDS